MINVKKISLILIVITVLFSSGFNVYAKPEYLIKYSAACAPHEPMAKAFEDHFKPKIEELSEGRIVVEVFHSNMLGGERDVVEGLQLGTIEMTAVSYGIVTNFVPKMDLFSLPYLFKNSDHSFAVLDSDLGMGFAKDLEKHGFVLLGYCHFGVRNLLTSKNPIHSLSDIKDLKIRTMEIPTHLDTFKALGASPIPMAYGEVYTAIQTGVIDGMEAANVNYFAQKFYEVAPHYAMIEWNILPAPLLISKDFFEKLPDELKQIVVDVARETIAIERNMYEKDTETSLESLKKEGVIITNPDLEPFREAVKPVYDKWAASVGGIEKIYEVINFNF